jgi:glycerol-3-phosphate dehydrogenase
VDDARLVVLTAVDAREHGATVLTRTQCTRLDRAGASWVATLQNPRGRGLTVEARAVVNATGPWVDRFLDEATPVPARRHPRMVKGSHIVVPRLFEHEFAYIFQAPDRRIVFAIPFEREFTLIGTTEKDYRGDLATPAIEESEIAYLLGMANRYFRRDLSRSDVAWTFAGLRPLLADPSDVATSVTRDYLLDIDTKGAPLLSIYGGKLTTYRRLAEDVLDELAPGLGWPRRHWTATSPLPGGDMAGADAAAFAAQLREAFPWLPAPLRERWVGAYGTRCERLLRGATCAADLGEEVLPGLHAREIEHLRREEWAVTAEDVLYRRSKLALHLPADSVARLDDWLELHPAAGPSPGTAPGSRADPM